MRSAMADPDLQYCFAPVVAPDTRLLILGSLPGEVSLARSQYYAHPRNQFWRLIGAVIERDLVALGYEKRLEALTGARIGLWDTVAAGRRKGSLDSNLRLQDTSDLGGLAANLPRLRAAAFNGGKAASLGRRQLQGSKLELLDLPSSSPAYTLPFERKLESWLLLRAFLPLAQA